MTDWAEREKEWSQACHEHEVTMDLLDGLGVPRDVVSLGVKDPRDSFLDQRIRWLARQANTARAQRDEAKLALERAENAHMARLSATQATADELGRDLEAVRQSWTQLETIAQETIDKLKASTDELNRQQPVVDEAVAWSRYRYTARLADAVEEYKKTTIVKGAL